MKQIRELLKRLSATGKQCVYCNREIRMDELVCADCGREEQALAEDDPQVGGILHVYRYDGVVRKLIHQCKYDDMPRLSFFIAQRMADFLDAYEVRADVVTFVPIHKKRLRMRGFDQAEMIAAHLSVLMDLPCRRLLERVRDTRPQFDLSAKERAENMRGAFSVLPEEAVTGKRILVIDDVYTSGATMGECVRLLLEAGADTAVPFVFSKE